MGNSNHGKVTLTKKGSILKRNSLFILSLMLLFTSCDVSKRITYFQDIQDHQVVTGTEEQPTPEIRLRPEDKVSIIVNSKVPELTALFNLPYNARTLGQTSDYTTSSIHGSSGYIIKADGTIDFPVLGLVEAAGKTRDELAFYIKSELINRNLVNDPVVIFADEATGNLDTRMSYEIMGLFQDLNRQGKTIVFVTHEPDIARMSKRTITLRDGLVISDEIYEHQVDAKEELAKLPVTD